MTTLQSVSYKAIRIRQTDAGGYLVLFAAPATEIDTWAGIPQKKEIGGSQETTGFQREEDKKRIKELVKFYSNKNNVIQNPLLCATRHTNQAPQSFVEFEPDMNYEQNPFVQTGILKIKCEKLEELSLLDLLRQIKGDLEHRVPDLSTRQPSDRLLREIKVRSSTIPTFRDLISSISEEEDEDEDENDDVVDLEDSAGAIFSDESHIYDFWEEVAARVQVLEELGSSFNEDEFLGYSKDSIISFLRPIVVVDGQHRLRGAVESAKFLSSEMPYREELENAIIDGTNPDIAQKQLEAKISRRLPISLLITDDPAEHVFQFVVVNQKATAIGKALLGTIVSTSLSNDELSRVSERLEKSGIQLEESRAVAYFTRNPNSPFYNLVERGLTSENKDVLQWNVLLSLVRIFQELKGGRIFGSTDKVDWSDVWRRKHLTRSDIVSDYENQGFSSEYEYWSHFDGPWRDVFGAFWIAVRDKFANTKVPGTRNYWGSPKESNIFNKVSLTILSADFFQYLCESKQEINNVQQVQSLVDDWLEGVDSSYFNRLWNPGKGLRKDTPAVRSRWAAIWTTYRKDPVKLPPEKEYSLK
jgi:hypothetical protein